jgi:hypothetical protein
VPAGTLIGDYVTLEPAEIVAGTTEVSVAIQARATGAAGNVKAYGLASVTPGIPGVDSVYNPQAISGGSDLETLEAYVERAKASLWLNSALISALDFESAAAALMGEGSKALCVPLLTGSKVPDMPGHVHLFLWGPDGEPISTAKAQAIREDLGARAFAGCSLWASPGEYSETWVSLVIRVPQATRDQASLIFQALDARYRHTAAVPGATLSLRQLSNAAWTATVTEVVSCQIDHADYDKAMPHKWTIARLSTIDITLVDPVGYTETFYYGTSDAFNDPD